MYLLGIFVRTAQLIYIIQTAGAAVNHFALIKSGCKNTLTFKNYKFAMAAHKTATGPIHANETVLAMVENKN